MHTLDALQALAAGSGEAALEALLLPVEAGLADWPRCVLDPRQAQSLGRGQPVALAAAAAAGEVNVVDPQGRSLGLGSIDADGRTLRAKRLFRWTAQA
jgi:tRNA pseudouridine55 synthase